MSFMAYEARAQRRKLKRIREFVQGEKLSDRELVTLIMDWAVDKCREAGVSTEDSLQASMADPAVAFVKEYGKKVKDYILEKKK